MAETRALSIREDSVDGLEVLDLLGQHLRLMSAVSPPESSHALDVDGLRAPNVTLWTAWRGATLLGCGALKELDISHGEIKSMHTAAAARRQGIGSAMLLHILAEARRRGYRRVSLETGSMREFEPARRLYQLYHFEYCAPFGDYNEDPNSVFMTLSLVAGGVGEEEG